MGELMGGNQSQRLNANRHNRGRQGAALIELSLVLFLMVSIVFGCVDFGRFASTHMAVTNAAREGANFGRNHPFTNGTQENWRQQIYDAVRDEMDGLAGFDESELTISEATVIAGENVSRIRVRVTYPFKPVVPWVVIPARIDITRGAEMPITI